MYRVAGWQDTDDFLGVTVDDGDLAAVAQRHREEIVNISIMLRPLGSVARRYHNLPGRLHVREPEFRRGGRFLLQEAGHDVDLLGAQLAGRAPVRHAGGRTVGDERLQVLGAAFTGDVRRERLAGCALAQYTVAARTALEVELGRQRVLLFRELGALGGLQLPGFVGRYR